MIVWFCNKQINENDMLTVDEKTAGNAYWTSRHLHNESHSGRQVYFVLLIYKLTLILFNWIDGPKFYKKFQSNFGRVMSPPLMVENNYATRSPSVAMGCPHIYPKTAPSLSTISNTYPSTNPTHHPKQHPDPISRFSTIHPPDQTTDIQTDGIGDKCVRISAYAVLYW